MSLSCVVSYQPPLSSSPTVSGLQHTGTFFCEITTAQSFPRTPTDVMLAAVMALNAYSVFAACQPPSSRHRVEHIARTDLVKTPLVTEDGDVSVVSRASYDRNRRVSTAPPARHITEDKPDMAPVWSLDYRRGL